MEKRKLGNRPFLYPYPVVLIGADVDAKPNFMTIAFCGIVNNNPGMIALGSFKTHHTNRGILENRTFSVNLVSQELLEVTDYIGMNTGAKVDKSQLFEVFYGDLKNAPMIGESPLNMECRVREVLDIGGLDHIIIGEIVETYTANEYLTGEFPDIEKMNPVVFSMFDNRYFGLGKPLGRGWSLGRDYHRK